MSRDRVIDKFLAKIREVYKRKMRKWIKNTPWEREVVNGHIKFVIPFKKNVFFQPPPQVRSFCEVEYHSGLTHE